MGRPSAKKAKQEEKRPYPLPGMLELQTIKVAMDVVFLSERGLLAKIKEGIVFVGRNYQCSFEFPDSRVPVTSEAKVMRTFDRKQERSSEVERVVELHFLNLDPKSRLKIIDYIETHGQK